MKLDDLLLHSTTANSLRSLQAKPAHAILITGQSGSGLKTTARALTAALLGISDITPYAYVRQIYPENAAITVEQVRSLQQFVSLKVAGRGVIKRVAVLYEADKMQHEAQNALLKTIEEPPADTVIILTATHQDALLPTVRSRVRIVSIASPPKDAAIAFFERQGHNVADIEKNYVMSSGAVGLMHALLAGQQDHPLVTHIATAKALLGASQFERLAGIEALTKQDDVLSVLQALLRICNGALAHSAHKDDAAGAAAWHRRTTSVLQAIDDIERRGNAKLVLTRLFMEL